MIICLTNIKSASKMDTLKIKEVKIMDYLTERESMEILANKDITANEEAFFKTTGIQKILHATLIVNEIGKDNEKTNYDTIAGITKYYTLCIMEIEKRQGLNEEEAIEMLSKYYKDNGATNEPL